MDEPRIFFLILRNLVLGHIAGHLNLTGTETTLFGAQIVDGIELDTVKPDFVALPVVLVARHPDDFIRTPLRKAEGAIAHVIPAPCPGRAPFIHSTVGLDGGLVHGKPRLVNLHGEQIRRGVLQR